MGQHKYNPTAIAAKNGELSPKERPKLTKRQREALLLRKIQERLPAYQEIKSAIGGGYYD